MSDRAPVLVLGNDFSLAAAKTSRHLCRALERIGRVAVNRDTRLIRWAIGQVEKEGSTRIEAYEMGVVAKWNKFVFDYGFDTVISLDLHWLFTSKLFVGIERIKGIHSFWFDDLRSHLQTSPMFSLAPQSPLELINDPQVRHHCYGLGQAEEMRLLGVKNISMSKLAASSEYLDAKEPCIERTRLAFIGNPGLALPPSPFAIAAMERGENRAALQRLARQEILDELSSNPVSAKWIKDSASVFELFAAATETRLSRPNEAAICLLLEAGRVYSEALAYLNRSGLILDAALLVKNVNRYDRPGLVHRFCRRGWLAVFGTPELWKPYGITARPTVPFPQLASVYRRYPAHLNAPNCARDATANEKLFEIAACGRTSLNLVSPDVRDCYSENEIVLGDSEETLEAAAERILQSPDAALALGENARRRTANEHLWEHRLQKALT